MTRSEALTLVTSWTTSKNLIKHMLAVESAMGGLAHKFKIEKSKVKIWEIVGLIHDADYEKYPEKHPGELIKILKSKNENVILINAIETHAWKFNGFTREPSTNFEWSLYCSDELTGLIVAVTLIRPTKKIKDVTVEDILKKWNKKDFAKGVDRKNIELCEEKLGIKLPDFIQIVLKSMQSIATELGL